MQTAASSRPARGPDYSRAARARLRDTPRVPHRALADLEAGLDHIRDSPKDGGIVVLIVRRPAVGEREVLDEGRLDLVAGLVGDTWSSRPNRQTPDNAPHPEMQLNVMNARAVALVAVEADRRPL